VQLIDDDIVRAVSEEREQKVPYVKHRGMHTGDYVKEGDPLVVWLMVPNDAHRIPGIGAVQDHRVPEVSSPYCSRRVGFNDNHIEIIVAKVPQVKVETTGDTGLLPGTVMDKIAFQAVNGQSSFGGPPELVRPPRVW
jgi:DNA-directed RNA polymerase subunit beta'